MAGANRLSNSYGCLELAGAPTSQEGHMSDKGEGGLAKGKTQAGKWDFGRGWGVASGR